MSHARRNACNLSHVCRWHTAAFSWFAKHGKHSVVHCDLWHRKDNDLYFGQHEGAETFSLGERTDVMFLWTKKCEKNIDLWYLVYVARRHARVSKLNCSVHILRQCQHYTPKTTGQRPYVGKNIGNRHHWNRVVKDDFGRVFHPIILSLTMKHGEKNVQAKNIIPLHRPPRLPWSKELKYSECWG